MVHNDIVKIYQEGARNSYGEKTDGASEFVKARVVEKSQSIIDLKGDTVLADLEVWLPIDEDIDVNQKIQWDDKNYMVVHVYKLPNEVGHIRGVKFLAKKYGSD